MLLKELAAGRMSRVYLALATGGAVRRVCALKVLSLSEGEADHDGLAERFVDEARVVTELASEHLPYVFDVGCEAGQRYLAMEYVAGKTLTEVWSRCAERQTAFPLGTSMRVLLELTSALAQVHAHGGLGLVHRDVSPSNVMLAYAGGVKLIDFGIAKWKNRVTRTQAGVHWGRAGYMAPEQRHGKVVDHRADLFAAGVIFWEMLAGRQLFPQGQLRPLREEVPPPSTYNKVVPAELDQIALKAISLDPAERYQSAEELNAAVAPFLAPGNARARLAEFMQGLFAQEIADESAERERLVEEAATVSLEPTAATEASLRRDPILGTVLGDRYEVLRLIGRGAMGTVYEGYHRQIRKRVAIKIPNPNERDPVIARRLMVEAAAAGQIEHPNIASVTDSGTTPGGSFYFVMEYLEGTDLDAALAEAAPLAVERALKIGAQVCGAAAAAHDVGVVHRDLKPSNVMLVRGSRGEEVAKVLDFGLAKFMRPQDYAGLAPDDGLTRPEATLGTPRYMAPEQFLGAAVDHRADVYSIGVILYEMLTGEVPVDGEDPEEVCRRKATEEPRSIREWRDDLRPELTSAVMAAVARNPADRIESARALEQVLVAELERLERGRSLPEPPVPAAPDVRSRPNVSRSTRWIILVAAAGGLGLGAWWFLGSSRAPSAPPAGRVPAFAEHRPAEPLRPPPAVSAAPAAPPAANPPPAPTPDPQASPPKGVAKTPSASPARTVERPSRVAPAQPTPAPPPSKLSGDALVTSAWEALQGGDVDRAIDLGRAALEAGAGSDAHFLLGKALMAKRRMPEALAAFERAARANPGDKDAALMAEKLRRLVEESRE